MQWTVAQRSFFIEAYLKTGSIKTAQGRIETEYHIKPSRSPDLNPLDFFLWGYLKDRVYGNKPEDLQALKTNIVQECGAISAHESWKVSRSASMRALREMVVKSNKLSFEVRNLLKPVENNCCQIKS